MAMQNAMTTALDVVDVSYRFTGSAVLQRDNIIQRCFRDVHTARMHLGFSLEGYRRRSSRAGPRINLRILRSFPG